MAGAITSEQVRHIALLGRLKLTDAEVERFTLELGAILGYIEQLTEVDVEGVEPTAHAVAVQNVFRGDEVRPSIGAEVAVSCAPQRQDTFFKVPKVLDHGGI